MTTDGNGARVAFLFPGQGCSLADAAALVQRHCADLYASCRQLVHADPFERAGESTRYAQPAIFLASIAGWRSLDRSAETQTAFAGHSLGELSALAAAGVFAPEEALRLAVLRGALMADAVRLGPPGGMLAVLKGDYDQVAELAADCSLVVANDNAPGQTVLSGPREQLRAAAALARERGLRAIALDVGGAFHSPAVASAQVPFERAVRSLYRGAEPSAPVFSCVSAKPFEDVPAQLAAALTSPVRWRETMLALDEHGVTSFIDAGPDQVLGRLVERNLAGRAATPREQVRAGA